MLVLKLIISTAIVILTAYIGNLKALGLDTKSFLDNMDTVDFFVKHPDVVKKIREDYAND